MQARPSRAPARRRATRSLPAGSTSVVKAMWSTSVGERRTLSTCHAAQVFFSSAQCRSGSETAVRGASASVYARTAAGVSPLGSTLTASTRTSVPRAPELPDRRIQVLRNQRAHVGAVRVEEGDEHVAAALCRRASPPCRRRRGAESPGRPVAASPHRRRMCASASRARRASSTTRRNPRAGQETRSGAATSWAKRTMPRERSELRSRALGRADALDDDLRDPRPRRKPQAHPHDLGAVLGLDHLVGGEARPLGHRRVDEARADRDRTHAVRRRARRSASASARSRRPSSRRRRSARASASCRRSRRG